jgi:lipopolysaccharide export system protein LptA
MSEVIMNKPHALVLAPLPALLLLACSSLLALPDDGSKPITIESDNSEFMLDEGVEIHYGTVEEPARIAQGSMVISGQEIRVERKGNALIRVTATGTPARSQQQPSVDQEIVYITGNSLVFDNASRIFSADGDVQLLQAGDTIVGNHIDYYIDTGRARGDQLRIIIQPEEN